jgi:hypothetical protein
LLDPRPPLRLVPLPPPLLRLVPLLFVARVPPLRPLVERELVERELVERELVERELEEREPPEREELEGDDAPRDELARLVVERVARPVPDRVALAALASSFCAWSNSR